MICDGSSRDVKPGTVQEATRDPLYMIGCFFLFFWENSLNFYLVVIVRSYMKKRKPKIQKEVSSHDQN